MQAQAPSMQGSREALSAIHKTNHRILPFLALMFVLAFLDRVNVGFAKEALHVNVGIGAAAYGLGAGIFFLGYVVLEIPSNLMLHRVGARRWLARIMVSWGLVAASMAFVQGPTSFYIVRVLLGIAEAGFFPGVILYLTYWYPNRHRSAATGLFYWGLPLAFIIGGPLSGALLSIDSALGLRGWQLMFIIQGAAATAVGVWAWFYLDDKPTDATWLARNEADALQSWIAEEERARHTEQPLSALAALRNPRVWYFGIIYFFINLTLYGVTFWLPATVGKIVGLSSFMVGIVSALPWIAAAIGLYLVPRIASRSGKYTQYGALCMVVAAVGLTLAASFGPVFSVAALSLAAFGFISVLPLFWNLPTEYLSGAAAAGGIALINSIGNLGSFTSPYFLGIVEGRTGSIHFGLYGLAVGAVICALLIVLARQRGARKRQNSTSGPEQTIALRSR